MSKRADERFDLEGEYNPSESEDEYSEDEKRLLNKVRKGNDEDSDSEEEVYGFSESESEQDDLADSDIDKKDTEKDLPDPRAWGKKKKAFYSTDYVDEDYGGFGKDEEAATLEEKEARILQNKLVENLEEDDFGLELFATKKDDSAKNEKEVIIKSDLSQMSKREKLQLLEKESPEFNGIVDDFKNKISLAKNVLLPIIELYKDEKLPKCAAIQFVKTQYELILNYCTNISFYILLKTKRISVHNHPVIKRLLQYRQMLKQLEPIYESDIKEQLEKILLAVENNEEIIMKQTDGSGKRKTAEKSRSSKKLKLLDNINNDGELEEAAENSQSDNQDELDDNEVVVNGDGNEKRAITYQMAKNKGLTPHRKKEQRNPRVKHRNKYRKAQIRRKGAVREVKYEMNRYSGEMSGIKANVKKSIKIK